MVESAANHSTYETADTILATYLIVSNFTLLDIVRRGPQGIFVFANANSHLTEAIQQYQMMQARVEPAQFVKAYKMVVDRVTGRQG